MIVGVTIGVLIGLVFLVGGAYEIGHEAGRRKEEDRWWKAGYGSEEMAAPDMIDPFHAP
jgi:uncharacterized membrane protein HdeD (DUF308 family)